MEVQLLLATQHADVHMLTGAVMQELRKSLLWDSAPVVTHFEASCCCFAPLTAHCRGLNDVCPGTQPASALVREALRRLETEPHLT